MDDQQQTELRRGASLEKELKDKKCTKLHYLCGCRNFQPLSNAVLQRLMEEFFKVHPQQQRSRGCLTEFIKFAHAGSGGKEVCIWSARKEKSGYPNLSKDNWKRLALENITDNHDLCLDRMRFMRTAQKKIQNRQKDSVAGGQQPDAMLLDVREGEKGDPMEEIEWPANMIGNGRGTAAAEDRDEGSEDEMMWSEDKGSVGSWSANSSSVVGSMVQTDSGGGGTAWVDGDEIKESLLQEWNGSDGGIPPVSSLVLRGAKNIALGLQKALEFAERVARQWEQQNQQQPRKRVVWVLDASDIAGSYCQFLHDDSLSSEDPARLAAKFLERLSELAAENGKWECIIVFSHVPAAPVFGTFFPHWAEAGEKLRSLVKGILLVTVHDLHIEESLGIHNPRVLRLSSRSSSHSSCLPENDMLTPCHSLKWSTTQDRCERLRNVMQKDGGILAVCNKEVKIANMCATLLADDWRQEDTSRNYVFQIDAKSVQSLRAGYVSLITRLAGDYSVREFLDLSSEQQLAEATVQQLADEVMIALKALPKNIKWALIFLCVPPLSTNDASYGFGAHFFSTHAAWWCSAGRFLVTTNTERHGLTVQGETQEPGQAHPLEIESFPVSVDP